MPPRMEGVIASACREPVRRSLGEVGCHNPPCSIVLLYERMDPRLDRLKQSLESAVDGMSSEQLRWHLPGKWCAAEVLEHLYLTYTGTTRGMEKVIAAGAPLSSEPSMKQCELEFVAL